MCDHILIISNGKIVADAPLAELENSADEPLCLTVKCDVERAKKVLSSLLPKACADYREEGGATLVTLDIDDGEKVRSDIFFAFAKEGIALTELHRDEKTLEKIFLSLTNDNYAEEADGEWNKHESLANTSENDESGYTPLFSSNDDEKEGEE